jgi:transcriptional regulator with XRE-family HTH domain
MSETIFFDNLKSICKRNGTSPSAVVRSLDLSASKVTSWKEGKIPKIGTLERLADALGVEIFEFFGASSYVQRNERELLELIRGLSPEGLAEARGYIRGLLSAEASAKSKWA